MLLFKHKKIKNRPKNAPVLNNWHVICLVYDNMSGVYLIKNINNFKCYVGSSIDVDSRIKSHFQTLNRGKHANKYLQSAFADKNTLVAGVLEYCSPENLGQKEDEFIVKLGATYNIAPVKQTNRFRSNTPKPRRKTDRKVRKFTADELELIINLHKQGKSIDEISIIFNVSKWTIYNKVRLIKVYKFRNSKPVFDKETGIRYKSTAEAAKLCNIPHTTLRRLLGQDRFVRI